MYELILTTGQRMIVQQATANLISDAIAANLSKPVIVKSGKNTTVVVRPEKVDALFPLK